MAFEIALTIGDTSRENSDGFGAGAGAALVCGFGVLIDAELAAGGGGTNGIGSARRLRAVVVVTSVTNVDSVAFGAVTSGGRALAGAPACCTVCVLPPTAGLSSLYVRSRNQSAMQNTTPSVTKNAGRNPTFGRGIWSG